ncbi:MAG TPA: beta-N-acetylhexosaminidase [Streptosporangiaceae bacterium]
MPDRLATLLPYPGTVRARPGQLALHRDIPVRAGPDARQAADAVSQVLGALPWPPSPPLASDASPEILVDADGALPAEGYRLFIGPDRMKVTAAGPAGAFYAAQTIRQLLPDEAFRAAPVAAPGWTLPCAEIEDAPALSWRGGHLDVSRHFFPKRTVLGFIDMLAAHKLNRLHLHLTDDQGWRIESRRHPALHLTGSHRPQTQIGLSSTAGTSPPEGHDGTPHGGYYTLADLAEIAAYAARRMIRVVPEVEVPGHACALLAALPELSPTPGARYEVATGWGIKSQIVAPLPDTVAVLGEIFSELLDAIPADYVHIGGDECVLDDWRSSSGVAEYRRQLGLPDHEALHAYFLRQVADLLADSFGARAVVWDEGFASTTAGREARLRDDTLVMAWRGDDIARRAALAGHDVIATPVVPTYFDYYQAAGNAEPLGIGGPVTIEDVAGLRPAPPDWPAEATRHLIGTQFQLWTEYIPDARALDYMTFPRASAFAEVAWHGGPAAWTSSGPSHAGRPPLRDRVAAHLGRLAAAGVEYRPLDGPHPWQQGGTGPRRHRAGRPVAQVTRHLADLAGGRKQDYP